MNTIKTSRLIFTAILACLIILTMHEFHSDKAPSDQTPFTETNATQYEQPQSANLVDSIPSRVPSIEDSLPVVRETAETSVSTEITTQSIDWQKTLFPQLVRISELEHESPDTALTELLPMLASDNPAVRRAAIEAVGDMAIPTVAPILSMTLNDPSPEVRVVALEALASQDNQTLAYQIGLYLFDQDAEVRLAAIDALANLEAKEAVYTLASLLSDPQLTIRRQAVNALGEIGGENAIRYLRQARYDSEPSIRANATEILMELELEVTN